ncbi:MAG: hypothetical protein RLZZ324_1150 [Candidatus Parcubacteria bacterium]|jgi:prepilin-type N-terminal cleavage/methylation domain-containing protein
MKPKGFTVIELMVTLGIIATLATVVVVAVLPARVTARDTARRATLNEIGRLLWAGSCLVPAAGPGEYDLKQIYDEYVAAHPAAAAYVSKVPRDPKTGTDAVSGYRYIYDGDSGDCALYANLERADAEVTLTTLDNPIAGGGTGVVRGQAKGPNGTDLYYQVSR